MPEVSFSKSTLAVVKDNLGLPDQFLSDILTNHMIRTTNFSCNNSGKRIQGEFSPRFPVVCPNEVIGLMFKLPFYRDKFYQVSISYDFKSRTTYGIILGRNTHDVLQPLLARLEAHQSNPGLLFHPLLVPILAIKLEMERTSDRLHDRDKSLNALEALMGQHEYTCRPIGNPLNMDFTAATRKLNYISKRLGVDVFNLGCLALSLETVDSWSARKDRGDNTGLNGTYDAAGVEMEEKTTWMKDNCRSLLLLAEYEEKRTKTLIQVVSFSKVIYLF
jgi:hypothetical protein